MDHEQLKELALEYMKVWNAGEEDQPSKKPGARSLRNIVRKQGWEIKSGLKSLSVTFVPSP